MENFEIKNKIKNSVKRKCLFCGAKSIKAHSISKQRYLLNISENEHVCGLYREKGLGELRKISTNDASTFYNFCKKCDDKLFDCLDNYAFAGTEKQIFMMYYRMLSAQIHQIKEEKIFFENLNSDHQFSQEVSKRIKTLQIYLPKLENLNSMILNSMYDFFNFEIISYVGKINFVYFDIINILYDINGKKLADSNEVCFNVFSQNEMTYIVLIWENNNDTFLKGYIEQLKSLSITDLQFYLTNLIAANNFNLFFRPSFYENWKQKNYFNQLINFYASLYTNSETYFILYNFFLKSKNINLFVENI